MPFGADLQGLKKQCIRLAPSGKYDGSIYVVAATWPVAKITVTACTTGPLFQLLHIRQGPKYWIYLVQDFTACTGLPVQRNSVN